MNREEALAQRDALLVSESRRGLRGRLRSVVPLSVGGGLIADPTPIAIGIAGSGEDYRLAVRFPRSTKQTEKALQRIVARVGGDLDVLETGRARTLQSWHRSEVRPLAMGASCAHRFVPSGTLGCFVRRHDEPGSVYVLSNNHVLAREDLASKGDLVLQPATDDGGQPPTHAAAAFTDAVELRAEHNVVDAAIAVVEENIAADIASLDGIGPLSGVRQAPLETGDPVHKVGRTTFTTSGRVRSVRLNNERIEFPRRFRRFDEIIEIEPGPDDPFSADGDSGALVVDENHQAVGLLFAKTEKGTSYANPIHRVLELLEVEILL